MEGIERVEAGLLERYDETLTRHRERLIDIHMEAVRWWVWDTHGHALDTVERYLAGTSAEGAQVRDLVDCIARDINAHGGVWSGTLHYRLTWPQVFVPQRGTMQVGPLYGDERERFEDTLFDEGLSDFAICWHQEV